MLAVIPGHLFVLVCDESLKRVVCPNWECLPFKHLYEPNDPSPWGPFFICLPFFFFFTIFTNLNCLPLSKGPQSCSKNIMAHAFQCVGSMVEAKCQSEVSTTCVLLLDASNGGPVNTKASRIPQLQVFHFFPIAH